MTLSGSSKRSDRNARFKLACKAAAAKYSEKAAAAEKSAANIVKFRQDEYDKMQRTYKSFFTKLRNKVSHDCKNTKPEVWINLFDDLLQSLKREVHEPSVELADLIGEVRQLIKSFI